MTLVRSRIRRLGSVLALGVALAAAGCADRFFHDPATSVAVPLTVQYSVGSGADAASPGQAFDKADRAVVVLRLAGAVVLTDTATFQPGPGDKRVILEVELSGASATGTLDVTLSVGGAHLFTGTAPVTLRTGQAAEVQVPLAPVETALAVRDVPPALRLGGAAPLAAVSMFATGDDVGPVPATWTALTPTIEVSSTGVVTGLATGPARVRATYAGLVAEATFDVRDPCLDLPAPLAVGDVVTGSLSRSEDCATDPPELRLFDRFVLDLEGQQAFTATLSSEPTHPFLPIMDALGVQRSGFASPEPSFTREFVFAPGAWTVDVSSVEVGTSLATAPQGTWSLTLGPLPVVQDGCDSVTSVSYGVTVSGAVQANDCEDDFDDEPDVVRWWDGLGMRMPAGERRTVSVTADFPYSLTHWTGSVFTQGVLNVPAGDPAAVTGTVAQTAFHNFFILSAGHRDTGNWTASVVRNGPTPLPNLVVNATSGVPGTIAEEGTFTLTAQVANAGGAMPLLQTVRADVYVAAQTDLTGPHALLGAMDYGVQLGNLATASRMGTFTLPPGVSGPHFVLVDLDAGLAVSESSERNLFVAGAMNVSGAPLLITTTMLRDAVENVAYADTLEATGGTGPATWSVVGGSLPAGLSLAPATGIVSGTPTVLGTSEFTVRATSPDGQTAERLLSITVAAAAPLQITTLLLPDGTLNEVYDQVLAATGGGGGYAWAVASGSLPTGVSLDPGFGIVSGLASALGTFSFEIRVTSADGQTALRSYTVTVNPAILRIVTDTILPTANESISYSTTIVATGGVTPYTWILDSGLLPAGLSLNPGTGVISGTPTTPGLSIFTIRVEDADLVSATRQFRLNVLGPPLVITSDTLMVGTDGQPYSNSIFRSGGVAPFTWSIASGSLPPGLSLDPGNGLVSGTPTATGVSNFTVRLASSDGQVVTKALGITVYPPVAVVTTTLPNGSVGVAYSATLTASGGDGTYFWQLAAGSLPAGLSLDGASGVISGTPTLAETQNFTVRALSRNGEALQPLSITINP